MAASRIAQIGTPSAVVVALTTAVAIASWFVFVRVAEPDWGAFAAVFEFTILLGSAIVFSIGSLHPRLREIRTAGTSFLLGVGPIVPSFAVFAVFSGGVDASGFDYDIPAIGAAALLSFLALAAALCGMLVYLMVVLPAVWLARAIRPTGSTAGSLYLGMGRGELVGAALIFPAIIAFAIAMVNMVPDLSGGTRRERQGEQFIAFVTFQGALVPSIVAWAAIVSIVACLVGYNRARAARLAKGAV